MKIPLYNCYWCRCGWCLFRIECLDRCIQCMTAKKWTMPKECDKFVVDSKLNQLLYTKIQKCDRCRYKLFYESVKSNL